MSQDDLRARVRTKKRHFLRAYVQKNDVVSRRGTDIASRRVNGALVHSTNQNPYKNKQSYSMNSAAILCAFVLTAQMYRE